MYVSLLATIANCENMNNVPTITNLQRAVLYQNRICYQNRISNNQDTYSITIGYLAAPPLEIPMTESGCQAVLYLRTGRN